MDDELLETHYCTVGASKTVTLLVRVCGCTEEGGGEKSTDDVSG